MDSLLSFPVGLSHPYNMPVYPGARRITAYLESQRRDFGGIRIQPWEFLFRTWNRATAEIRATPKEPVTAFWIGPCFRW